MKRRGDITNAATLTQFIEHCTTATSLSDLAKHNGVSRATMKQRLKRCWLVDVPDPTAGHDNRVYDQGFLDGTYTAGGCSISAATLDHLHQIRHKLPRPPRRAQQLARPTLDCEHIAPHRLRLLDDDLRLRKQVHSPVNGEAQPV